MHCGLHPRKASHEESIEESGKKVYWEKSLHLLGEIPRTPYREEAFGSRLIPCENDADPLILPRGQIYDRLFPYPVG
jgi:hypothetical protein